VQNCLKLASPLEVGLDTRPKAKMHMQTASACLSLL